MFEALARVPECELWVAEHDGTVIAGALCLRDRERVIYWHAAALDRALPLRPANLLLETTIADACERGSRVFDLGSSGGHEGVEAFKRSFGAAPLPSAVVTVDRGLMRAARTLRKAVPV
jgi:CelD/BcsL family acetyltransferase involved in cellulose biosynthesis